RPLPRYGSVRATQAASARRPTAGPAVTTSAGICASGGAAWIVVRMIVVVFATGYRIEAARVPRMATANAACCQPAAFQAAMATDGVCCIGRARGIEAALVADPRAEQILIGADQRQQQGFHGRRANLGGA